MFDYLISREPDAFAREAFALTRHQVQVHDKCMAVKTITIDLDAYELLSRHKKPGQSFSEVIKEHFGDTKTATNFRQVLSRIMVTSETLSGIERQIKARRKDRARAARI